MGARQVIDYPAEDFTGNGRTCGVIYDGVGEHSFRRCKGSLTRGVLRLWPPDLRGRAIGGVPGEQVCRLPSGRRGADVREVLVAAAGGESRWRVCGPCAGCGLRFIIVDVVAETACHAGRLDAVRESGDGRQWIVIRSWPGAGRLDDHVVSTGLPAPPAG